MRIEDLTVVYQDDSLLVLEKPSGLLVHRGYGRDDITLVDLIRQLGEFHPAHRLDRGTSGVILCARGGDVMRALQAQFEAGTPHKTYLALVRGRLNAAVTVDHPVPKSEDGPKVDAQTSFAPLAWAQTEPRDVTWVVARPVTGRFHQIRRHLKHLSHPIIGDANYGKGPINRAFAQAYGLHRLALHAAQITIRHPDTQVAMTFCCPLPDDLREPLEAMGVQLQTSGWPVDATTTAPTH